MSVNDPIVQSAALDFDAATLPWLDQVYVEIDRYVRAVDHQPDSYDLREALISWMRFGYVYLPGLVETSYVDDYVADVAYAFDHAEEFGHSVVVEGPGLAPMRDHTRADLAHPHMRMCDFHNASVAGKRLALHPRIVEFLGHVFRAPVVAMQTLTFIFGSEQWLHQDFPYVVAQIPSHLAASWIPLEDVRATAGPLGYYAGSHAIRKFDWGNGMFLTPESQHDELAFQEHLKSECTRAGLDEQVLCANRGDVFFWHSALAHRGTPRVASGETRKTLVTHYSTLDAYPTDRRAPGQEPTVDEYGGGSVYRNPLLPGEEDMLKSRHGA